MYFTVLFYQEIVNMVTEFNGKLLQDHFQISKYQKQFFSRVCFFTFLIFYFHSVFLLCMQTGAREECTAEEAEGSRCDC